MEHTNTNATAGLHVIITGATGMVGEGVLIECLKHPSIEQVLVINRKPCGITHPKLKEVIHSDFFDLSPKKKHLRGFDACFFCAGVSSVGMREEEYYQLTYVLTLHVAHTLAVLNPEMTFCYVSGVGTDSTEKGKVMWARVKGKTENELMKLPFQQVYNFRPGFLEPTKGMQNTKAYYKCISWLTLLLRKLAPKYICSLGTLGKAMIHAAVKGCHKPVVEVPDMVALAKSDPYSD